MYHPAAALHQPALKELVEKDFDALREIIAQARAEAARTVEAQQSEEKAQQMRLF
jgi:DNA-binding protein YbaB